MIVSKSKVELIKPLKNSCLAAVVSFTSLFSGCVTNFQYKKDFGTLSSPKITFKNGLYYPAVNLDFKSDFKKLNEMKKKIYALDLKTDSYIKGTSQFYEAKNELILKKQDYEIFKANFEINDGALRRIDLKYSDISALDLTVRTYNLILNSKLPELNYYSLKERFKFENNYAVGKNNGPKRSVYFLDSNLIDTICTISHEIGHQINNQGENRLNRSYFEIEVLEESCAYLASYIIAINIENPEIREASVKYFISDLYSTLKNNYTQKEANSLAHHYGMLLCLEFLNKEQDPYRAFKILSTLPDLSSLKYYKK